MALWVLCTPYTVVQPSYLVVAVRVNSEAGGGVICRVCEVNGAPNDEPSICREANFASAVTAVCNLFVIGNNGVDGERKLRVGDGAGDSAASAAQLHTYPRLPFGGGGHTHLPCAAVCNLDGIGKDGVDGNRDRRGLGRRCWSLGGFCRPLPPRFLPFRAGRYNHRPRTAPRRGRSALQLLWEIPPGIYELETRVSRG